MASYIALRQQTPMERSRITTTALGIGVAIGLTLSVVVLLIRTIAGQASFDKFEVSPFRACLIYLAASSLGGLVVGIFHSFAKLKTGAATLGFLVCALFATMLRLTEPSFTTWQAKDTLLVVMFGALLGVPLGGIYREIFSDECKRNDKDR